MLILVSDVHECYQKIGTQTNKLTKIMFIPDRGYF